ncbi:MAG: hypothetical protein U9R69_02110 [Thermodesulfobacteriota bacterium]|nr:hypothetical protein [Thermodesulfobacteriota bacterium]
MKQEHFEILLENMDSKFNILIEGYQTLNNKIGANHAELKKDNEFLNFKIDTVNDHLTKKIDAVATDLKAHRNDTEAHQIYQVKEG